MVVAIIFMVSVVMVFMVSMSSSVLIVIVHGGIHYDVRGDSPFNGVHEQNLKKKRYNNGSKKRFIGLCCPCKTFFAFRPYNRQTPKMTCVWTYTRNEMCSRSRICGRSAIAAGISKKVFKIKKVNKIGKNF